jgi:hypothetical protein
MAAVRKLTLVIGLMVLTKLVTGHMHMKSGTEIRRSQTYLPLYTQLFVSQYLQTGWRWKILGQLPTNLTCTNTN